MGRAIHKVLQHACVAKRRAIRELRGKEGSSRAGVKQGTYSQTNSVVPDIHIFLFPFALFPKTDMKQKQTLERDKLPFQSVGPDNRSFPFRQQYADRPTSLRLACPTYRNDTPPSITQCATSPPLLVAATSNRQPRTPLSTPWQDKRPIIYPSTHTPRYAETQAQRMKKQG